MSSLCLFSTQRPNATDQLARLQGNALRSWAALGCPIVLFGTECTTSYLPCTRPDILVTDRVDRGNGGLPLIGSMFENVQREVKADLYCYVNADILLTVDLLHVTKTFPLAMAGKLFIAGGQRWDVEVARDIPMSEFDNRAVFKNEMHGYAVATGKLHSQDGIDYFMFPRGMHWPNIPPLVVGHPAWDNWMLWDVIERKGLLIDLTSSVAIYHQNHPCVYQDELTVKNRAIAGRQLRALQHATHVIHRGKLLTVYSATHGRK